MKRRERRLVPGRFEGQVALVTGGASGIGRAVAARLIGEGARVFIAERNPGKLRRAERALARLAPPAPRRRRRRAVEAVNADVSVEADVEAAFERVMRACGRLDVAVHSAGLVGPTFVNLDRYPSEEFDRVVAINLRGTFLVARAAIRRMLPARRGRVLLMASMAGREGNPGMIGYSASKAGVFGVVKSLGKEYAGTGITVNGLAPALVRGPLVEGMRREQVAYMEAKIPMGRMGEPEEAAALASWMCSGEASFTTGFVFDMSGGRATY